MISVSGTATYLERIAMPPDAVLTVRIEDVSFADNSAPVMAESRETFGTRQVPIPFMLKVPCGGLDKRARYSLRADISAAGQKRFGTDRDIAVLMPGAPDQYDLLLVPVLAPAPIANASSRLRGYAI